MMKIKNLAILAVIIVALAVVSFMQKSSHQKSTSQSSTTTLIEGGWTTDNISKITLGLGAEDSNVTLMKTQDHSWSVKSAWDAPGDSAKISSLLQALSGLQGEFRSDNEKVLPDYKLDADQAVAIRGFTGDGETAFAILVGTMPTGARGNFVRLASDNRAHLSQKNLLNPLGLFGGPARPTSKHFIAMAFLDIDQLAVDRIVLQDGDQTLDLAKVFAQLEPAVGAESVEPTDDRSTWEWKLASDSGLALAKTKVDALLNSLLGIRAVDVADPTADLAQYGLQNAARKVTIFLADGSSQLLEFGGQREAVTGSDTATNSPAGYWAQLVGSDGIWIITDYVTNNIFKNVDDLKAE